jgi:hypothetical protein
MGYFLVTWRVAEVLVLLYCAEITTEVGRETRVVVTLKLADVAPAGTMRLAGTVATLVLLLIRLITAPPDGAGALSVTVPVEVKPPLTLVGLRVSARSVGSADDVGVKVKVGVGSGARVGVGVGGGATVGVGDDDEAPTHKVALTFELL